MKNYVENIKPLNEEAMGIAKKYHDTLVKPAGSLGRLEDIAIQIAGITGSVKNKIDKKIHFVLGADNGIYEEGVASAPQDFTNLLLGYYAAGQNCGINVLCNFAGVDLKVVDMGVKGKIENPELFAYKLMEGTNNFAKNLAMSKETAQKAIDIGIELAKYAHDNENCASYDASYRFDCRFNQLCDLYLFAKVQFYPFLQSGNYVPLLCNFYRG